MKVYNFKHLANKGWVDLPDSKSIDSPKTLIIAFCSPHYRENKEPLKELSGFFPNSIVTGCSTSGEIYGNGIADLSMSIAAIKFDEADVKLASMPITSPDQSYSVGRRLSNEISSDDLKGAIILTDGLSVNGSALIHGFNSNIDPEKVSVSGGLAGDGNHFENTWVLHEGQPVSNLAVAIGMYGDGVLFMNSSRGGWDIFGPERTITKSVGNIVYEIDGQPALDLYKKYLGERAKDLPASALLFPLQIRSGATDENKLVRTILSVDEESHSMIFAGDVPQGYRAQLMRANFERVIEGASEAGESIVRGLKEKYQSMQIQELPKESISIAISCVGRRLVLGERADEEVEVLHESLGENANLIGFYSYGELAPHIQGKACDLHNQSMTVMSLTELTAKTLKKVS